jgi:predicted NBD/HSP70 family sugar kinase
MSILGENGLNTLRAVRKNRRLLRYELAGQLGVSVSLATKICAGLLDQGLLRASGHPENESGGRPASYLTLAPDAGYAIGLDFDVRGVKGVVLDLSGCQVAQLEEVPGKLSDREAVLAYIQDAALRLVKEAGVHPGRVYGIGISLGRTVDPVQGVSYGWRGFSGWEDLWEDFPMRTQLQPRIRLPHVIVDDVVRALGIAEAQYGLGSQEKDFVYVLVDAGIGMAFMNSGLPYIGTSHIAMELGHIPIQGHEDVRCACGNTGCLEELVSYPSILCRLQERMSLSPVQSALRRNGSQVTIDEVIEAASASDKLAYPLLIEAGEDLGRGLAVVVNLLGPGLIVVGGVLSKSDVFLEAARRELKLRALQQASRVVEVVPTKLDATAAARGSATQVLNALFEPGPNDILALHPID